MYVSLYIVIPQNRLIIFCTVNDNILPAISQIVVDMIMAPEFARLPRMNLIGFHVPSHHLKAKPNSAKNNLPHLEIYEKIFTGGQLDINEVSYYYYLLL